MKTITFICLLLFVLNINSQIINFPDSNFKTALLTHTPVIDTNSDSEIQESEANSFVGTLDVSEKSITDITGIEYFTDITVFYCFDNSITNIDMINSPLLVDINADNNLLTSFSVVDNANLEILHCSNNPELNTIDVTQNLKLKHFRCKSSNLLGTLDCSNNVLLTMLSCNDNDLTIINIANGYTGNIGTFNLFNQNLEYIYVDNPDAIYASMMQLNVGNSVQIVVDPDATAAIESNTLNKYISVYPNPTTDLLNIETDKNINSFEIIDIKGNIVMSKNADGINQIRLKSLANGIYFCKIKDDLGLTGLVKIIKK